MKKKDLIYFFETLWEKFRWADTELNYSTPFQLLVAVIMSAQTTDKQVNKVTWKFFDTVREPQDVVALWLEERERLISSVNFYRNKAKHIFKTSEILSQALQNDPAYKLSQDRRQLQKLPWVGEKTAKVVVHVLYDVPVIAVDTHVHRVTNRIWLVKTKEPLETSKLLEKVIPDEYKSIAHHSLIHFGRYHCTARKPKCNECPFVKFCVYV